ARRGCQGQNLRRSIALGLRPCRPTVSSMRCTKRRVESVVAEPRRLALDEREQLACARGALRKLAHAEACERRAEHTALQRADGGVVDARERAHAVELTAAVLAERFVDEGGICLSDSLDRDVDRVEREGRKCAVRARLAFRELVRGQDLDEALT